MIRLTNRDRRRLVKAVRRDTWSPQAKADAIAAIENVARTGLTLDSPEYNGDAPLSDPNAVVLQLIDYHYGLDFWLASIGAD